MGKVLRRLWRGEQVEMRLLFFGFVMVAAFGALIIKLWSVQVTHHTYWKEQQLRSSEVSVRIPALRG
ncbi:MAG: hypothetical protein V4710_15385, partial [Verrucomicrobiota bacterium]